MANIEAGRCYIRKLRTEKGLTQEQLAELSSVPRSTISSLENNKYVIEDLPTAKAIAKVLGCVIDDLYEWKKIRM